MVVVIVHIVVVLVNIVVVALDVITDDFIFSCGQ